MSYRSIKRVLGENSLERKCRILFGVCMFLLIGGAFYGVMRITENVVREDTRVKAKEIVQTHLLKVHMKKMQFTDDDPNVMLANLAQRFSQIDHQFDYLVLNDTGKEPFERLNTMTKVVDNNSERAIVEKMVNQYLKDQIVEHNKVVDDPDADPETEEIEIPEFKSPIPSDFEDRLISDNKYQFYQALIYDTDCRMCHHPARRVGNKRWEELPPEVNENGQIIAPMPQLIVVRLTLPYETANSGIYKARALLLTLAIVTAFLATAALYAIMRYVIVKPLKHLQSVIQSVSKGRMDVRSDLNTGDEFEELSKSLNRMLRHLADSQSALHAVNEDLDRKVDEQAQLTMKLYEMNQIKSDFLANMSHELRTPLNSIIGFSEVLGGIDSLDDKQKGYAENIRKSGHHLLELINNILEMAKLDAGKSEVRLQDFSIAMLAEDLYEMIRPLAEKKNIELRLEIDKDLPQLYQDFGKIRQILTNLLSNAVKFTPEGGRIRTKIKRADDDVVIKVQDSGVGIAEDDRRIIFEKFRQAPSTIGVDSLTRRHSGSGLGLSIVKELCILLGGEVSIESEVGKGSIFTVTLPCQHDEPPAIQSELSDQIEKLTSNGRIAADSDGYPQDDSAKKTDSSDRTVDPPVPPGSVSDGTIETSQPSS